MLPRVILCVLATFVAAVPALAQAEKKRDPREDFAVAIALTEAQKSAFLQTKAAFDKKIKPMRLEMWTLYKQENKKLAAVLTDAQRDKLQTAIQSMRNQELDELALKLKLTDEQKAGLAKLCDTFAPKFRKLVGHEGEEVHRGIQDLRAELLEQTRPLLKDEQREKLAVVLRAWPGMPGAIHDDAALSFVLMTSGLAHFAQPPYLDSLARKLELTPEQKEQFQKTASALGPTITRLGAAMLGIERAERDAIERLLTDEQRAKWRALRKANGEE